MVNSFPPFTFCLIFVIISSLSRSTAASGPVEFTVAEQAPVGTVIGNVSQQVPGHDPGSAVRYRLRQSPSSRYFDLDELTGLLRTAEVLDREDLCPYEPFCQLIVDVIATGTCAEHGSQN